LSHNPDNLIRLLTLARKISTREGFVDEYLDRLPNAPTCGDAYWSVEDDHETIFGRTRYNGHDTFKTVLSKWNKIRRKT
tara:strand:- start:499 stop:735 length:237 start_codon:yes stop_codon:yes gene_type:complete